MENLKLLRIEGRDLDGLPLFFRKIYYNAMTELREEYKLITYRTDLQADTMSEMAPRKQISKTVDFTIFGTDGQSERNA